MRTILLALALIAAVPAMAQIRAHPEAHILRNAPAGTEEETPAVAPPVNLRPTQLLRCPDGKGGITLQDTPCKPATAPPGGAAPASAPEVIDLSQLQPRPQVEAPAPRVDDAGGQPLGQGRCSTAPASWRCCWPPSTPSIASAATRATGSRSASRQPEMPSRVPRRIR